VVITVRGARELVARAGHLFAGVTREFACAARDLDTWSQPAARQAVRQRRGEAGPAAFTVRKLLSPAALVREEDRRHLRQINAAGAQVRISAAPLPHETILIDRSFAILAAAATTEPREYTVTNSPSLVGGVYALFDAAWQAATELDVYLRSDLPHLGDADRAVLGMLAAGHTDESSARQLGLSLRTYRRRVAGLMAALEAGSRFQAGLRAGTLGLNG